MTGRYRPVTFCCALFTVCDRTDARAVHCRVHPAPCHPSEWQRVLRGPYLGFLRVVRGSPVDGESSEDVTPTRDGAAARARILGPSDYESGQPMRVYVPSTLPGLAEAHKTGEIAPGPLTAYAVTPGLREWYLSDDIEELEYAALNRAAAASLRMLATDPGVPRRRVVVAADVPDREAVADPDQGLDPASVGEVRIASAVQLAKAAAVHVDSDEAHADVSAAADALGAADLGDDDAQFTVDGAADHELLWFGVQEIPGLIG
jgi:hypothetical protein